MPTFLITGPDGKKYRVTGENAEGALDALRQTQSGSAAQEQPSKADGVLRSIDDFMRGAADTSAFGFADEASAGMGALTGVGGEQGEYSKNLAAERARDAEGGWSRTAGQVAGAFLSPAAAAKTVAEAALKGAGYGAAYGFGSGEETASDRLKHAGGGALIGAGAGSAAHLAANAVANRLATKAIPTLDEIKDASRAGYDAADAAGVVVKPQGVARLSNGLKASLTEDGYLPALHPKVKAVLDEADRLGGENVTFKGLQQFRRVAKNAAGSADPDEARLGGKIVRQLEAYMKNLPADDVLMGNAAQASAGFRQGTDNWAKFRRGEMVDTALLKAERRAASTGSGGNLDNTIRQNVRGILDNPRRSRGMTDAELAMADTVIRGTPGQNALRLVGKMAPTGIVSGGIGSSAGATIGSTIGGPVGASIGAVAVPTVGAIAKALADRGTVKNADALSEMIRSGGQTGKQLAKLAEKGVGRQELIEAIMKLREREARAIPAASRIAAALAQKLPLPY